eukprot:CAMPEP_0182935652 /NCGR_PEP_ID=MMETSP0105_2-20130417/38600_1 /TAXON_ID=81532 ORGANISM="Acanthoeca-like sp., Strain 10tr" /NCGR_SAMPLE_ID=MMETSP0105_2 /ASSEMBLY_ACC=CAM_ASM_000205 /LENGTH=59 /DNA_ID=CAMNT_0025074655 /DNA_START=322 /DNA_END=497 /DNA_ORIENTATION=+
MRLLPALRELFDAPEAGKKAIRANLTPAWHASQLAASCFWAGVVFLIVSNIEPREKRGA